MTTTPLQDAPADDIQGATNRLSALCAALGKADTYGELAISQAHLPTIQTNDVRAKNPLKAPFSWGIDSRKNRNRSKHQQNKIAIA
jgi:hypothetical protein